LHKLSKRTYIKEFELKREPDFDIDDWNLGRGESDLLRYFQYLIAFDRIISLFQISSS
jgi:hypothetical protein